MLSEATEDNLIDLGPGSPAVVSPRITSSPPLYSTTGPTASPARNATTASLSSALAGLGKSKLVRLGASKSELSCAHTLSLELQHPSSQLVSAGLAVGEQQSVKNAHNLTMKGKGVKQCNSLLFTSTAIQNVSTLKYGYYPG